jgi:hypothetical protein
MGDRRAEAAAVSTGEAVEKHGTLRVEVGSKSISHESPSGRGH